MSSSPDPITLARVIAGRKALLITRSLDLSACVCLIFDYIETFHLEREHFWKGEWSWPRVLFFINRYFAIVVQLFNTGALLFPAVSLKFCQFALVAFLPWTGMFQIFVMQAILCVRLHAMYGKKKRILYFLLGLFVCTCLGAIGALAHQITIVKAFDHTTNAPTNAGVEACITVVNVKEFWTVGVPVVIFDLVAFSMASYKAYELMFRPTSVSVKVSADVHVTGTVRPIMSGARLMRIMVSHSLLYFLLISAVYAVNIFLWRVESVTLSIVATGYSLAALSIAGNRMLLAVRQARAEESDVLPQTITSVGEEYFEFSNLQANGGSSRFMPMAVKITSSATVVGDA